MYIIALYFGHFLDNKNFNFLKHVRMKIGAFGNQNGYADFHGWKKNVQINAGSAMITKKQQQRKNLTNVKINGRIGGVETIAGDAALAEG